MRDYVAPRHDSNLIATAVNCALYRTTARRSAVIERLWCYRYIGHAKAHRELLKAQEVQIKRTWMWLSRRGRQKDLQQMEKIANTYKESPRISLKNG
jgi:hypothetical protein